MDQSELAPARIKLKHPIPFMINNALTEYTSPDLITITDDLIDFKVDDTNYDMFNKESVLIGLLLVAKKLKKMSNEDAIYIQDNVGLSTQYLIKHNMNEYIIEGVRKVVDVIINDEEDDMSKLLPEKKADLVKMMISKIGELQGVQERKDNPNTIILIERIFEQGVHFLEM